jgi:hypothetical protein
MADLELIEFEHDPDMVRRYLRLVRRVHANDPLWVAPLERTTARMLSGENPFFESPANAFRGFALRRGGELAGHVLATVNGDHIGESGERIGALGFLEVEPEYTIFRQLIEPALAWLEDQAGASRVWATMNFDIWHGYRVMTRGFHLPPFLGEPRNGPWLPEFLECAGFERRKSWVSATTSREFLVGRAPFFRARHDEAMSDGYRIRQLQAGSPAEIARLHHLVVTSFEPFFAYTPVGLEPFASLLGGFLRLTGTELATVLEDPQGEAIGFSLAFADPMPVLKRLNGHDGLLSRWRALLPPAPDRALHYMIGVLPGGRTLHAGLGSALMYDTLGRILEASYPQTTFALMADDSPARYFAMDQAKTAEREYALFERTALRAEEGSV